MRWTRRPVTDTDGYGHEPEMRWVLHLEDDELDKLTHRVRELSQARPRTTATCVYVDPTRRPVCIVGHALVEMFGDEVVGNLVQVSSSVGFLLTDGDDYDDTCGSDHRIRWLRDVQREQDRGARWSVAVEVADQLSDVGRVQSKLP